MKLMWLVVVLLVFMFAYMSTDCPQPMVRIGGECCLDGDDSGVCDEDELGEGVECELPYIAFNGSCCLDSNGNRVCDMLERRVEAPTTTSTTSTSTTSTSTTSISMSSSTTSTSTSTSTTLEYAITYLPTSTTLPVCLDTDGGELYTMRGNITGLNKVPPHTEVAEADFCINNETLREFRCEGDYVYSRERTCESGMVCTDGRCCVESGTQCRSSAECCSGNCTKKFHLSLCY
jgi:hypothetical protein